MSKKEPISEGELKILLRQYAQHKRHEVGACPPTEDLLDYYDGKLNQERNATVLRHLVLCNECGEFALALKFFRNVEDIDSGKPRNETWERFGTAQEGPTGHPGAHKRWNVGLWGVRKLAAAALIGLVCIVGVWYVRQAKQPDWVKIQLSVPESIRVRDASDPTLGEGLEALKSGDFDGAREKFGSMLLSGAAEFEARYYIGLSYLLQAQRKVFGFGWVDLKLVDNGIEFLRRASHLATTRENQTDLAECQLQLGKAYLMKGAIDQALERLRTIETIDQSSMELIKIKRQANDLIAALASKNGS